MLSLRSHRSTSPPFHPSSLQAWISGYTFTKPPSDDVVTLLKDPKAKAAAPSHSLSADQALRHIIDCARTYKKRIADSHWGKLGLYDTKTSNKGEEDWLCAIFGDIDEVLFGGVLGGNVCFEVIDSSKRGVEGLALGARGVTRGVNDDRNRINVVIDIGFGSSGSGSGSGRGGGRPRRGGHGGGGGGREDGIAGRMELLSALLHQMIHAYLLQTMGFREGYGCDEGEGHDLGHKDEFATIAYVLQRVHAPRMEMDVYPARFGCVPVHEWDELGEWEVEGEEDDGGRSLCVYPAFGGEGGFDPRGGGWKKRGGWGWGQEWSWNVGVEVWKCKHLFWRVKRSVASPEMDLEKRAPKDSDGDRRPVSQWFHSFHPDANSTVKKYKPILRSAYTSLGVPYVEIQFAERSVPVPQASLGATSSLTQRKNGYVFKLETKDEAAFADLHSYLTKGRYGPPQGVGNASLMMGGGLAGVVLQIMPDGTPVAIEDGGGVGLVPTFPKPVLRDVRAYRVGSTLGIPELQQFALSRLCTFGTTAESPVQVLEYLYYGTPQVTSGKGDKDKKGKEKAGGCGLAEPDELIRQWCREWLTRREGHHGGRSNLEIIKDPTRWGAAFQVLREKGGLLIADTDAAEADLQYQKRHRERARREDRDRRSITGPRGLAAGRGQGMGRIDWVQEGQVEEEELEDRNGNRVRRGRENYQTIGM